MKPPTFHRVTFDDKAWIDECLASDPQELANLSFATNYIWGDSSFSPEVARLNGCGVYRCRLADGTQYFTFPFGAGDKKGVVDALRESCRAEGVDCLFAMLSESQAAQLQSFFPGEYLLTDDRDNADYVYSVEDLATLAGSRYQPKRNHVRRFKSAAPWSFEPLAAGNVGECDAILSAWIEEKMAEGFTDEAAVRDEAKAIRLALADMERLGCFGGLLRREGRAVAFTLGERLTDTLAVAHFEKARVDVEGAYQTINQEFAKELLARGFKFVNREEDTGLPNLRKAKMSYHPSRLVRKYAARTGEVVSAAAADKNAIADLWAEAFHDSDAYIRLFLEKRLSPDEFLILRKDGEGSCKTTAATMRGPPQCHTREGPASSGPQSQRFCKNLGELAAMAAFLPTEVHTASGESTPVRYVYALATAPKHRGRGLAAKLLDFASAHYGVPLVLVPAEAELEAFYGKLGFEGGFRTEAWSATPDASLPKVTFRPTDARTFSRRREETATGAYVKWDETAISFAIESSMLEGGGILETDKGEIVLYERRPDGDVRIVETTASAERREAVASALLARVGGGRAFYDNTGGLVLYPADYSGSRFSDAYLNLALD